MNNVGDLLTFSGVYKSAGRKEAQLNPPDIRTQFVRSSTDPRKRGDSAHSDYRSIADQVSFDVSGRADLCFKTEDGRPTIHLGRLHPLVEASGVCMARTSLAAFVMSAFIIGLAGGLYAHFLRY
jgi:hypothetical protein